MLCRDTQFLPTVIVDDFEDVTPELLKEEYTRIMNIPLSYWRWDHLTQVSGRCRASVEGFRLH
jgi:hypothetical protein